MKCFIGLVLLCAACTPRAITVQHEYLDRRYLASSYAHTVDPRQSCYCGEMLLIRWRLPKACMGREDLHLLLTMRYRDGEVGHVEFPITKRCGSVCYRLMNPKWACKGGILTYKVELVSGEETLDTFKHQVWAELIEVPV